MSQESKPVDLLWTGGWDSTYRLIYLLVKLNKQVQPHYIIDADRKGTRIELVVRNRIAEMIFARYPETRDRLCPTIFLDKTEIPPMPAITKSYDRLHARVPIGSQYEWMARYVALKNLQGAETCIHTGGTANRLLDPMVLRADTDNDHYYLLDSRNQDTDEYQVFGRFRFPVYDVHKVDMEKVARENGWIEMMKQTWFCQNPMADDTPCGRCHPCVMVMKERMYWRMPVKSRFLYYLTLRPYTHSQFYQTARNVKRFILPARPQA